ncbi:hypothetical protein H0H93_004583 [Arthromyces matolae]|nr:hypothetical protein H0H93_004583 [Arthromyces matolae]
MRFVRLKHVEKRVPELPRNCVLVLFVAPLPSSQQTGVTLTMTDPAQKSATTSAIEALLERYSLGLKPLLERSTHLKGPLVVLLTGSTGNLGSEILARLLENDRVERVYTFNRPSARGDTIEERQLEPFRQRSLNTELLRSSKLSHVIGDATQADLGIERDQYLASWPSSRGPYPEEVVNDPSIAAGSGYGASKYIAERIIAKSGLNGTTFRIGQICGAAPQGAWDTTELIPILIKTSIALRSYPDVKGIVSWIPMNAVAAAIVEAASSNEVLPPAVNLVNPQRTTCENINANFIGAVKDVLGVHLDLVPMRQWISVIERFAVNASADTLRDIVSYESINPNLLTPSSATASLQSPFSLTFAT